MRNIEVGRENAQVCSAAKLEPCTTRKYGARNFFLIYFFFERVVGKRLFWYAGLDKHANRISFEKIYESRDMVCVRMRFDNGIDRAVRERHKVWEFVKDRVVGAAVDQYLHAGRRLDKNRVALP